MNNNLKRFIYNPTLWIASILVLAIILILVFFHNDEYKANIVTELASILITIAFIDVIFAFKKEHDTVQKQKLEIIRLNNLFYIYLSQYKGAYDRIFGNGTLKYSDISKLLKPAPSTINLSLQPAYIDFFRVWIMLLYQAENFIAKLDLGEKTSLIELLENFIIDNMLIEELRVSLDNTQKLNLFNEDIKRLENTETVPSIDEKHNSHIKYAVIYNLLVKNNSFINEYERIIDTYKAIK